MFKFDIKVPLQIFPARFSFFDLPLKLRVVYLRNKQTNSVTNMAFYKHVQYSFCCYVIKSAGKAANKVLLSVVWNPLLIEINLSQIRALDIKREKVCAVCPVPFIQIHITINWIYFKWIRVSKLLIIVWFPNVPLEKKIECFTSKPNALWTFWNLHIKINFNKRYGHTTHTFSRLLSDILIWGRFIS